MRRLETKLDGPILFEPVTHGDERGFFPETYRRNVFAELGIPEELSRTTTRARARGRPRDALPDRRGAGQARALRRAGAIFDVVVDLRRGSPTFGAVGGASSSTTRTCDQLYCPIGFAHGFCVLSATSPTCCTSARPYYDESIERGIAVRRSRTSGSSGPTASSCIPSQRDANAPLPARDRSDELPFRLRRLSRRRPAALHVVRRAPPARAAASDAESAAALVASTPFSGRSAAAGRTARLDRLDRRVRSRRAPGSPRVNSSHEHAPEFVEVQRRPARLALDRLRPAPRRGPP